MSFIIVDHNESLSPAFKRLNKEWIDQYFVMEANDVEYLGNPGSKIIAKGGQIKYALIAGEAVGVCALVKSQEPQYDFELSKMAVAPLHHGKGIGKALAIAVIATAKALGAQNIYLDSNTKLAPAIALYKKLGFIEVKDFESVYDRSDIRMVLRF